MFHVLVVLSAVASQLQVDSSPLAVEAPPKWEIYFGATGGVRPDAPGGGGAGVLGINRRVTSWLRPELVVGLGGYSGPAQLVTVIRIGARLEWPGEARLKPYLWLAFAHNHEVAFESAKANPVGSALGLSEDGVDHRSGLDTGLGVSFDLPLRKDGLFAGRLNARASLTQLLGAGPPRYVDLTASIGLCF